ncbi:MAG TPA: serine hydrolase domain-containing protein [Rhodanobacter sp.]|nr:serine hydrolase domain-containing protein [Rhodanobacter sp.]
MNRWVCAMLLAAMTLAGGARAQIEIHPLPDAAPATPVPLGGHALTAADAGAWIDAQLASALRDHAITGAAVAIVVDGEAKVLKGYGRDGDGHPIDGQATRFALGNASATFTWTALMQLAAAGKVDLDADVGRYLGTSSSPRGGRPPTLRQLMTHTAEFTDTGNAQPADAACVMRPAVSDVAPSWSRCDAALAARVVAHVSGMDLATYVARWVFEPIGMPGAAFGNPAGDATATAPAMGNYLAALLPGNRPIDAAALPPAEARQMLDASVPLAPGVPGMALGWRRFDRNGWQAVGLASPTPAGSVLLALVPDSRAGLFIALDGRGAGALGTSLFDGFMGRYFPPRPSVAPARPATAVADAARLAGSYQSSRAVAGGFRAIAGLFGQARITAAGGEIITRDLAGMTGVHRWRETVPSRWQGVDGHGYLGVAVHDGRVQHVAVRSLAPPEVWRPVPRWASARWNLPLLWATLALLAVLTLAWPLVAWRGPRDAAWRWLQGAHAAALVQLGCAVGWAWVARLPDAPALAVRGVQVLGVAALAGVVVAAAGTWQAWRRPCRAWWRLDSGLLLAGGLAGAWFILAFGLLAH